MKKIIRPKKSGVALVHLVEVSVYAKFEANPSVFKKVRTKITELSL